MSVSEVHPEYNEASEDWAKVRDAILGERAIKKAGTAYLPMPSGFLSADDNGASLYAAYQMRARFGEYTLPTVSGMVGVIHPSEEKSKIDLPTQLEYIWEDADGNGASLESFHQAITEGLVTYGRVGIQVTAPKDGGEPYLVLWSTIAIVNWDDDFIVLNASKYERDGFTWEWKEYRRVIERTAEGTIISSLYEGDNIVEPETEIRSVSGPMELFPFVVVNANGVGLDITPPPVLGVARAAVSEYQLSADYRWQLYMSGQETLVIINGDAPEAVGAGVVIELKGDTDGAQPDAKYVGPTGAGIEAHSKAMEEERNKAVAAGAKLLQFDSKAAESGDALRTRFRTHASTLMGIAQASARGLERALRVLGALKGLAEEARNKITVSPPKDLANEQLTGQEAESLVRVWQAGGMSKPSLFENLQRGGLISPERDFEAEEKLLDDAEVNRGF